jgi:hypothetical protein
MSLDKPEAPEKKSLRISSDLFRFFFFFFETGRSHIAQAGLELAV